MKSHYLAVAVLGALLAATVAHAQHVHGPQQGHGGAQPGKTPHAAYAGLQGRAIKALSEQQVQDLRAGKGMSLALPAELNGYPGPSHVLELADPLQLTPEQKSRTQALFVQMQDEARAAGEDVITAEAALDTLFKSKHATPQALRSATAEAAQAQGRLRETHLRYHLAMVEVLSPEQVAAYNRLRGY